MNGTVSALAASYAAHTVLAAFIYATTVSAAFVR